MRLRRKAVPESFKWRHFSPEIILLCVRWYLSYRLSYRDLVEMMDERGLKIAHTTILRWVFKYAFKLEKRVQPYLYHAMGYHNILNAWATPTGVEIMHMIRKGQASFITGKSCAQKIVHFMHKLFDIPVPYLVSYSNRKSAF